MLRTWLSIGIYALANGIAVWLIAAEVNVPDWVIWAMLILAFVFMVLGFIRALREIPQSTPRASLIPRGHGHRDSPCTCSAGVAMDDGQRGSTSWRRAALVTVMIGVIAVSALTLLGTQVSQILSTVGSSVSTPDRVVGGGGDEGADAGDGGDRPAQAAEDPRPGGGDDGDPVVSAEPPKSVLVVPVYDRSDLIHRAIATLREKLIEESIVDVVGGDEIGDLDAAILLERDKPRGACLHSQQCVEKALNALRLEKGRRPPRTHDVVELLNAVAGEGWRAELDMDDAVFLNSIYRGRYPTEDGLLPHGEPSAAEAERAVSAARQVMQRARAALAGAT